MAAIQGESAQIMYNLSVTGHGDYDRSWEDYIDFIPGKGIVFDSHDYTYGMPQGRDYIKKIDELPTELIDDVRKVIIDELIADGRIFDTSMWIGSSTHYNFNIPCNVVRSRKFRGSATLISISSKRDIYNRECYKAFIVGSDRMKYYVSPNCIQVDKEAILSVVNRMNLKELVEVLDECHYGHWNFHPYNRHLFAFPRMIAKYASKEGVINIRSCIWGWKANEASKEQLVTAK